MQFSKLRATFKNSDEAFKKLCSSKAKVAQICRVEIERKFRKFYVKVERCKQLSKGACKKSLLWKITASKPKIASIFAAFDANGTSYCTTPNHTNYWTLS